MSETSKSLAAARAKAIKEERGGMARRRASEERIRSAPHWKIPRQPGIVEIVGEGRGA
jgi:hypothetical protein